jgi:hypothetical protein
VGAAFGETTPPKSPPASVAKSGRSAFLITLCLRKGADRRQRSKCIGKRKCTIDPVSKTNKIVLAMKWGDVQKKSLLTLGNLILLHYSVKDIYFLLLDTPIFAKKTTSKTIKKNDEKFIKNS